jgi:UDP-N-acetylglucosamine 1-carboxyvinyltransferase
MPAGQYFSVTGGQSLSGTVEPQGAKNEALQVIAATLLTDQPVTLHRLPMIADVRRLMELLQLLGVSITELAPNSYQFQAANINPEALLTPECIALVRSMRGSILLIGPLMARFGLAYIYKPGGDKIGRRRLDVHILGLEQLGAAFDYNPQSGQYRLHSTSRLTGKYILLDEASVTGTANILMAASLAKGETTIYHAACEPYVQQLCLMLKSMGAQITGIGSNLLQIQGVERLNGTDHLLLADMIEVGSFIGMAAMTQSKITITNADTHQLGIMPATFQRLGVQLSIAGNNIEVDGRAPCLIDTYIDGSILTIADHPWPGLTPDILSVLLVVATQCKGTVLIHQKMFESRLFFVDKLIDMGAQIILCDPHRATVVGLNRSAPLRAISMSSPDIRAGIALLIAALSAEGTSKILNIEQIDRGYEQIDTRLQALGAHIQRLS